MSTPIWDEGRVLACLCAQTCDRWGERGRCLQLLRPASHVVAINICLKCMCELAYAAGRASAAEFMTEGEREFLNRTWCATCQSHFCSCGK